MYTSVRAGWWVVCNMGGRGTFSVAARSAVISRLCTAFRLGTGSRKRVSPPATKDALARCVPAATLIVPVMRVTVASSRAGAVWLKWPPYTGRATSCLVSAMHSEATTPVICPGVHSREVTSRSHSPAAGLGQGVGNLAALQGHRSGLAQGVRPGEGEGGRRTVQAQVVALGLACHEARVGPHTEGLTFSAAVDPHLQVQVVSGPQGHAGGVAGDREPLHVDAASRHRLRRHEVNFVQPPARGPRRPGRRPGRWRAAGLRSRPAWRPPPGSGYTVSCCCRSVSAPSDCPYPSDGGACRTSCGAGRGHAACAAPPSPPCPGRKRPSWPAAAAGRAWPPPASVARSAPVGAGDPA